jgi:hypothetical protein
LKKELKSASDKSTNLEFPVIIWNKNQILKWVDFKKKSELKDNAAAVSAIGFKSKPLIEYIKTGSEFKFKIIEMELDAIFIPNFSWVMKNINEKKKILLLKHEQGHFDLAEEVTRKTRIDTVNRFKNKVFTIKEKKLDDAKKKAVLQVNKIRKKIEAKLQNELERQEAKYDKKTNHGLITVYQKKYNKRFKKLRQ